MMTRLLLALSLLAAPLYTSLAQACPCNEQKSACACPGGGASCPSTCTPAADGAKKTDAKKDGGKGAQPAPKK